MTIRNLDALLQPASIALIGASPEPGSIGNVLTSNLLSAGFAGPIALVNPKHTSIDGHPCVRSIAELTHAPDLAVIATPPATIPRIIAELGAKGTRAAVVLTAGLDGALKQQMLDASRPHLLRILGPNGLGLMLPRLAVNATFAYSAARPGNLAFVSQSGALVTAIVDWASDREIGFSHVVSLGDMADVDFGDLLDYLAGDIHSHAILLYMEAVTHAPKFMSAARRAARSKPVVVIKSGRHATAAKAAASHTGRLAGADLAYAAAFLRAGLVRVFDLDELFEAAEVLSRVTALGRSGLHGDRLAILTNGGGAGVLAADRLADQRGVLAELGAGTRAALDGFLPPAWSKSNPVDIIGDADAARTARALDVLLDDPGIDAVLQIHCPTAVEPGTGAAHAVVAAIENRRQQGRRLVPVLTNWLGGGAAAAPRALFNKHGVPTFETPGSAASGFMHLVSYMRAQDELQRTPPSAAWQQAQQSSSALVKRVIADAQAAGRSMLTEPESKALIRSAGLPVVETVMVSDPDTAADTATHMLATCASLALKIVSPDITHKSDVGGVALDLDSGEKVRSAALAMLDRVARDRAGAKVLGFSLSPMIRRDRAHELIVGMSVDATFGPLILFGAGGVSVEVLADTAIALPPLDRQMAVDLIRQTRVARLLAGYRDRPPVALDKLADAVVGLSELVAEHPEIREIDINPLLADEHAVLALDARVRIAMPSDGPRVPMVIRPYPRQWEKRMELDPIGGVLLRPIRPSDEPLYKDFLAHVTAADHRLRFFSPKHELSHRFIARLTQLDYAREMAFAAIAVDDGRLLGVSRLSADPDLVRGEYAVLVRSDLKGRGLGFALMRHLIDYAKAHELREIFGSVLPENTTMLRMCTELGFAIRTDASDPTVRIATLDLTRG